MGKPLSGITVVNTRPAHQASCLTEQIIQQGGRVIEFPTLAIRGPHNDTELNSILRSVDQFDQGIFVSANAVNAVKNQSIDWPDQWLVWAIGPATKVALEKLGFTVQPLSEDYNSEGLLASLAFQQEQVKRQYIGIFCGEHPRPLLRDTLRQRGAIIREVICYCRTIPDIQQSQITELCQQHADIIISTSPSSLDNLVEILGDERLSWLKSKPLLVVSEKMQDLAADYQLNKNTILADNASVDAIINTLIEKKGSYHAEHETH